jgi:hypothetical protein
MLKEIKKALWRDCPKCGAKIGAELVAAGYEFCGDMCIICPYCDFEKPIWKYCEVADKGEYEKFIQQTGDSVSTGI